MIYLPSPRYDAYTKVYKKKTLIFDLDETLIHCLEEKELGRVPDLIVRVPFIDDTTDERS